MVQVAVEGHHFTELMAFGIEMVHASGRRAEIEKRKAAQEAEWRRLQRKVFSK